MKTMTCAQLGGACDLPLQGATADEVIQLQDKHLKEAVAGGDAAHEPALNDMKGRWKRPIATSIEPAATWYSAEAYHQDYLRKNPGGYTCHYLRD